MVLLLCATLNDLYIIYLLILLYHSFSIFYILQNEYVDLCSVNANGGWIIDSNIKDVIIIADIEPWLTSFTDIPHSYVDYKISINNNLPSSMHVPGKGGDKIQLTTTLDYKEERPGWDNIINKSAIYQDIYPRYQDISLLYIIMNQINLYI